MKKISIAILATIFVLPWSITATKLHDACNNGNLQEVERLIIDGADVNTKNDIGNTPLHRAAIYGHKGIVKLLLDSDADVNTKNDIGNTPLHNAASGGHKGIVKLLLDRGADLHATNKYEWTPLHNAASGGHEEIVKILLDSGADVNAKNNSELTPLHRTASGGHEGVAKLLIEKYADVNAKNKYGWTPLHNAAYGGHEDIVKLLLDSGADANTRDNDGWTSMHVPAYNGHAWCVKQLTAAPLLLKQSSSINSKLSKEALNKLDDYCVGYSREVFNLQLIPSNAPRLKSRGFETKDLAHSSPVFKDMGFSGLENKDFKFFQNLSEPAMESVVDNIFPVKNYIESQYIKAFLKLCYQDLEDNPGQSAFANSFIHEFYKNHLSELKLYIAIKNNDKKTAIDQAKTFNKKNIVTYLETIEKAKDYDDLDEGLRKQTENNYQQLLESMQLADEPIQLAAEPMEIEYNG